MPEKTKQNLGQQSAAGRAGKLGALWCDFMHDSPTWPIHGQYQCRTCGRSYPVPWMSTVTTISDCSIVRVDKADTVRLFHDKPAFSGMFLHYLLSRNIRIVEDLVDHIFNSSEKRLARVLLLFANFGRKASQRP